MNIHRKLYETVNATELCPFQCDPYRNPTGICMPICSLACPPFCNSSPGPEPPEPPPSGGFTLSAPAKHHAQLSLTLKISVVVLILTFSLFLLYTLYKFYSIWYRSRRGGQSPRLENNNQETHARDEFLDHDVVDHPIWYIRTIGLNPSVINGISVLKYKKGDGIVDGSSCSVCLSDFLDDESLRLLPKCNHAFHVNCIDTWLRSHTNCPLCRAGIVKSVASSGRLDHDAVGEGRGEEAQVAVSIMEEVEIGDEGRERVVGGDGDENVVGGGSGVRRSVSLNGYGGFGVRSDVHRGNNYYSDRHDVQIRSLDVGDLGFEMIKVDQTEINGHTERE